MSYVKDEFSGQNYELEVFKRLIGKKVCKPLSGKPFKSGSKINTVKGIIKHPILNIPAFTFNEDDSYVECRRCEEVKE